MTINSGIPFEQPEQTYATVVREDGSPALKQTFPTPEHEAVWQEFYNDPDTQNAQARFQGRLEELKPLAAAMEHLALLHQQESNNAHLQFQQDANVPMYRLTRKLMELDAKHAEKVSTHREASEFVNRTDGSIETHDTSS